MHRTAALAAIFASTLLLSACVVAPLHGYGYPHSGYAGAGVYVAPTYRIPAPGFAWRQHHHHGWGWHHPNRGWHRGWR